MINIKNNIIIAKIILTTRLKIPKIVLIVGNKNYTFI